jgi:hypothetical protein
MISHTTNHNHTLRLYMIPPYRQQAEYKRALLIQQHGGGSWLFFVFSILKIRSKNVWYGWWMARSIHTHTHTSHTSHTSHTAYTHTHTHTHHTHTHITHCLHTHKHQNKKKTSHSSQGPSMNALRYTCIRSHIKHGSFFSFSILKREREREREI